jgi:hypothetical protein
MKVNDALAITDWLVELFPVVYVSPHRIACVAGKLSWVYKNPMKDLDDVINVILYGVNHAFFERVVAPRLADNWKYVGYDGALITFEGASDPGINMPLVSAFNRRFGHALWVNRNLNDVDGMPEPPAS